MLHKFNANAQISLREQHNKSRRGEKEVEIQQQKIITATKQRVNNLQYIIL